MSKVKVALELDLAQTDQRKLYDLIGQFLGGEAPKTATAATQAPATETKTAPATKPQAKQPEPQKQPETLKETTPAKSMRETSILTMDDIVAKAQTLVNAHGPAMKTWMVDHGHAGRIPDMPEALWGEFFALLNTLDA